jgi:hypothetical protein
VQDYVHFSKLSILTLYLTISNPKLTKLRTIIQEEKIKPVELMLKNAKMNARMSLIFNGVKNGLGFVVCGEKR